MGKKSFGFPGLRNVSRAGFPKNNIDSNIKSISRKYSLNDGYIADKAKKSRLREFYSVDPVEKAKRLFNSLGRGGVQYPLRNRDGSVYGWKRVMKNATITYRPRQSSDNSPVVEIHGIKNPKLLRNQKIHFYNKEGKAK